MISSSTKGQIAEDHALKYLLSKGYVLLEKNFRCKLGELDIICSKTVKNIAHEEIQENLKIANHRDFNSQNHLNKFSKLPLNNSFPHEETICFIEVKSIFTNNSSVKQFIFQKLSATKKVKIKKAIHTWLRINNCQERIWQFEFIGIILSSNSYSVEHFENVLI